MNSIEILLITLTALSLIAVSAKRLRVPAPIAFVLGGIALSFLPEFPKLQIAPEYVLLVFLPVLLAEAAYFTSIRDFRNNLRPILQLAVGLVFFTSLAVSWVMQMAIPGFGWAAGIVLGAIISPPDAVAATAIAKQVKMPRRVQNILEGESLVNDAVGLVIYKFAVAAAVTGAFSLTQASLSFVWMAIAGPLTGLILALGYVRLFKKLGEPSVQLLGTFLVSFAAYILAEQIHASGVLAVVACGLTISWHAPALFSSDFRFTSEAVWRMIAFVLNGIVFMLIGFQFTDIVAKMAPYGYPFLFNLAATVCLTTVAVRFVWVYALTYGLRLVFPKLRARDPVPPWQNVFIVAWTGMRGVVSLATALALPVVIGGDNLFPRDLIIFLSFSVILFTLVIQGMTLPWLLRKLAVVHDWKFLHEDWHARKQSTRHALEKLAALQAAGAHSTALERIQGHYQERLEALGSGPNTPLNRKEAPSALNHPLIENERKIWQEVLEAEKSTIISLRREFVIGDDVMHDLMQDIDLMHMRFR